MGEQKGRKWHIHDGPTLLRKHEEDKVDFQDVNSTREDLSKSKLLVTKREQPNLVSFNLSRGGE